MTPAVLADAAKDLLKASAWMEGLTEAQADRVHRDVETRAFAAGGTVCRRGAPSDVWIGVVEGMLKIETVAEQGKAATFAGVPAGAWLGEGAVLKGEPRPYDVVAVRDSTVAFIPRATFLWLLAESHPFALSLIHQLNARLGYYVALVQSVRLNGTTAQVAYCLAELFNADLYPATARLLSISQEEIGRLSGLSRQVANRALGELHQQGVIRVSYGAIEVLDLDGLRAAARRE